MIVEVRRVADARERRAAIALRRAVFVDEQHVSPQEELDGRDDQADHLVAVRAGEVIGTCRLLHEGDVTRLGRMAVARESRRAGIATRLLAIAEDAARAAGAQRIVLHAQIGALGLYRRAGYRAHGAPFLDAGIEHVEMDKRLVDA